MKRGICLLIAGGLMFFGPAALANPHGHGSEHAQRDHDHDDDGWEHGNHHGGWNHGGEYGGGGYGGGSNYGQCGYGGCGYQQNGPYSQGYRDGTRQGTYDGQQDCGRRYRGPNRDSYQQDEYNRGYTDGYAAAYSRHCA